MQGESEPSFFEEQLASLKALTEQLDLEMYDFEWEQEDVPGSHDLRRKIETSLGGLLASPDIRFRIAALNSEWCTKEMAEIALNDSELVVRIRAVRSAGMTEELYLKALSDEMVDVREVAVKRTNSLSTLKLAFEDDSVRVKRAVIKHHMANEAIALQCLDGGDLSLIRTMLLDCPSVTEHVAMKALAHREMQVRRVATESRGATEAVLRLALQDKHKSVRSQARRRLDG